MKFGKDLELSKIIGARRFDMSPKHLAVENDLVSDMVMNQKCTLTLSNPHEFSASLAKLMCLGDEIFETDTQVTAKVVPYPLAS